jgi:quercetin 2,3-dioxygenase
MQAVRKANDRGHADHGWLRSFHSFSFAGYYDPDHMGFGPLRVINEDRVQAGQGFGTHGHRDMEIISYVLDGELEHKDSIGTGSVIRPGDVQRMSAGKGIRHSEFNPSPSALVHFLQIWIEPDITGIDPSYEQKHFNAPSKRGVLRLVASPDGSEDSVTIHQNVRMYAGLFDDSEHAVHDIAPGRTAYIHVARGEATINGQVFLAGDALKVTDPSRLVIDNGKRAEVLVFDLPRVGA